MQSASESIAVPTHNLAAALAYAKDGFLVFPMYEPAEGSKGCTCRKKQSCTTPGKHPRTSNGFNSASINPAVIEAWWTKSPNANIGIATGRGSNLVVIDVDERHGGIATMEKLEENVGETLPATLTAATGNGFHYYFRAPDQPLRSIAGALGTGVDIRAERGCVVAPPSLHANGRRYEFVNPEAEIAVLPKWIIDWLQARTEGAVPVDGQSDVSEGIRNERLTSIAGRLRSNGADFTAIRAELVAFNHRWCKPPLPEYEVDAIAKSISKYPVGTGGDTVNDDIPKSSRRNPPWWFPMDVSWWNDNLNISVMDAEQIGWYISLLLKAWPQGGTLPANMPQLAKLARAKSLKVFERKGDLLLREFERHTDDGTDYLVHAVLREQYAIQRGKWEQRKEAGLKSAEKRREAAEASA
jgi:uncharacterized protein YdaU (DUF1376 family)